MDVTGMNNMTGHVLGSHNMTNVTSCLNCSDVSSQGSSGENLLKTITTIVLTVALVIIMFAVGCHIDVQELLAHLRRPFGILIGFLAQFVLLPLAAFAMGHVLQLPPLQALGMLVMSCCPGGSTSNIFTYWVDGDVPLSVSMTTVNTALSSGMLPLNLWIYGRGWSGTTAAVPYKAIAEAFAMVALPAAGGILLRWKWPKVGQYVIKVGSVVGALVVVLTMGLMTALYPYMFNVSWRIYVAVILLPTLSFLLGYLFAWIARMNPRRRRTISLETGIQNFPLCMTLLVLSFPKEELGEIAIYPLLFGTFIIVESLLFLAVFRLVEYVRHRMGKYPSDEKFEEQEGEEGELAKDEEAELVGKDEAELGKG